MHIYIYAHIYRTDATIVQAEFQISVSFKKKMPELIEYVFTEEVEEEEVSIYMYVCKYVCMDTYMYMYVYVWIYLHICMYTY
jgi:hypothetical protein